MPYTPIFDPYEGDEAPELGAPLYLYSDEIKLAVNVALATGRPLLLRGLPGTGKSTLAVNVAWKLGWRYYEEVVTSRTTARDLQWRFDSLRRLQEAQVAEADPDKRRAALEPFRFVEPGVLWWALDPASARTRGVEADRLDGLPPLDDPARSGHERAVVLLDEIDKADPDVPNNLLGVLGANRFTVVETGTAVTGPPPLVLITTNAERELPEAFLRRCVVLTLEPPNRVRMLEIGRVHFPEEEHVNVTDALLEKVYERLETLGAEADHRQVRRPSTAEYLDAVRACAELRVNETSESFVEITNATLWKGTEPPEGNSNGTPR